LNEPSHAARNSASPIPIADKVARIVGHVPSPTPIVGMSGASISVTDSWPATARRELARRDAASQPAVPPPTMTILSIALFIAVDPKPAYRRRHAKEPRPERRDPLASDRRNWPTSL
jgi:hypothetical protein